MKNAFVSSCAPNMILKNKPHQPREYCFPKRSFGNNNPTFRSFVANWFDKWTWLHYSEEEDKAYCWVCMKARRDKLLTKTKTDPAFTETGYQNWKNASTKKGFIKHEESSSHKEAVERVIKIKRQTQDIGEALSATHSEEKAVNRKNILKIMENIKFLARQALALRGHADDSNSNFMQLLHLRAIDCPNFQAWLKKSVIYKWNNTK